VNDSGHTTRPTCCPILKRYRFYVAEDGRTIGRISAGVGPLRRYCAKRDNTLLMARVARIGRARDLLPTYQRLAADLRPVVLHSTQRRAERDAALRAVRSRTSGWSSA
jgi:hypothetical protein